MKFSQIINEGLKFKEFKPGMVVSIKRTPWSEEENYKVDSIDKDINDEVEVTLKNVKNGEEYIVDKAEMNIIEVKKIKDPKIKNKEKLEKEKPKESDKEREIEKPKKSDDSKEEEEKEQNEELELQKLFRKLR
ncbi:MAG: hypothetical protein ACOCQD_02890 [archaeon]